MTRNQLPEGVGKKIVEALKRQAEADITPLAEPDNTIDNNIPLTGMDDLPDINLDDETNGIFNDNTIIEEDPVPVLPLGAIKHKENKIIPEEQDNDVKEDDTPEVSAKQIFEIPAMEQSVSTEQNKDKLSALNQDYTRPVIEPIVQPSVLQVEQIEQQQTMFQPNMQQSMTQPVQRETFKPSVNVTAKGSISIPANVAVLKNLIASLPVGVTKQTGAQIIRQTLEAMGIPMNGVLKEAQEVQEELNSSTRECMLRIQEYKTNILQLEQSVQEYQRNITQINDLVSLFLLTDRK